MNKLSVLIKRVQDGDRNAFGEIYSLYYAKIYRYCQFHTGSIMQAQDVCQETFLKAWKALPSFSEKNGGTLQAFLFKIARNMLIDLSKKKKETKIEEYLELESHEDIERELEKKDATEVIRRALMLLGEKERQIVTLHYFEELSGEEIAKVVGMKEGALRVRTHRILEKLKEIIGEKNGQ